jgi:CTP synthase
MDRCGQFEEENKAALLERLLPLHGILVPGGFGERGTLGKIAAIQFAREHKIPFFGICLGLQMAVVEACVMSADHTEANSTEFAMTSMPAIGLMTEWAKGDGSKIFSWRRSRGNHALRSL